MHDAATALLKAITGKEWRAVARITEDTEGLWWAHLDDYRLIIGPAQSYPEAIRAAETWLEERKG